LPRTVWLILYFVKVTKMLGLLFWMGQRHSFADVARCNMGLSGSCTFRDEQVRQARIKLDYDP